MRLVLLALPLIAATSAAFTSAFAVGEKLDIRISVCPGTPRSPSCTLAWSGIVFNAITKENEVTAEVNVTVPKFARENGTLYLSVIAKNSRGIEARSYGMLTVYAPKPYALRYLLREPFADSTNHKERPIVNFWKPAVEVFAMAGAESFSSLEDIPVQLRQLIAVGQVYTPVIFVSDLAVSRSELIVITNETLHLPLRFHWKPTTAARMAWFADIQASLQRQEKWGASAKESDDVKRIFVETHPIVLWTTVAVSCIHIVFDILAFKNDIAFWRKRNDDMEGISVRSVAMHAAIKFVVFLYLYDNDSSLLVLVPSGISVLVDAWKLTKAYEISWQGGPSIRPRSSYARSSTSEYDAQAFRFLNYFLVPGVIAYAAYSLVFEQHRGWYSWGLGSLTSFAYACGFAMMTPQLFINYKLKTVAHLPWRALIYRASNTFIDDLFAWIIKMPTMHRISCLRDDVVFIIYLYQRWIYPIDAFRQSDVPSEREAKASTPSARTPGAGEAAVADSKKGEHRQSVQSISKRKHAAVAAKSAQATPAKPHCPVPGTGKKMKKL